MSIDLTGSPYSIEETGQGVMDDAQQLSDRVERLRSEGKLSEATLRSYFGDKRFEQIAESNAIEGSTLTVGETQLAVLRGITITGHDPAFSKDAISLANALDRIAELAVRPDATDLEQLHEIHRLILGDQPGSGIFRSEPVIISGSAHKPPRTWAEIMDQMEAWQEWSVRNIGLAPLLRGVVLHTWLTHVHPFIDGNGRTARALLNLELIRGGYPTLIIRKKDKLRYYDALAESDSGGDLGPITELVLDRAGDALRDLERAARTQQGYDEAAIRLRSLQERKLAIWNDSVKLLFSLLEDACQQAFGSVGSVSGRWYDDQLGVDEFAALSRGDSAGNSWLFSLAVEVPAVGTRKYLAWTGFRSHELLHAGSLEPGPAIFWSIPDETGYRKWVRNDTLSPGVAEFTLELPNVDRWLVRSTTGEFLRIAPSALARKIVKAIEESLT